MAKQKAVGRSHEASKFKIWNDPMPLTDCYLMPFPEVGSYDLFSAGALYLKLEVKVTVYSLGNNYGWDCATPISDLMSLLRHLVLKTCNPLFVTPCNMAAIRFCDGLKNTWDVRRLPLADFLQEQAQGWGRVDFNRFEFLAHDQVVTVYFDHDTWLPEPPSPGQLQAFLQSCFDGLVTMFGMDPDFDLRRDVVVGHRHGFVPAKQQHKVSFRFWVPRYTILLQDHTALLRYFAPASATGDALFDLAVYNRKQKLGIPGACKEPGDHRTLQLDDRSRAGEALAQVHRPGNVRLQGFENGEVKPSRSAEYDGQLPLDWQDVSTRLETAGFRHPRRLGVHLNSVYFTADNKGEDCPCCPEVHDSQNWWVSSQEDGGLKVMSYSKRCRLMTLPNPQMPMDIVPVAATPQVRLLKGLRDFGIESDGSSSVDTDNRQCNLVRQHLETCPTCSGKHDSDLWYIYPIVQSCWSLRNSALNCTERLLPYFSNPHLDSLATNPGSDRDYAELFISEHRGIFLSDAVTIYRYNGVRWEVITGPRMQNFVQDWLTSLLKQLFLLVKHEEAMRQVFRGAPQKSLKPYDSMLTAAQRYLGKESNMKNLLQTLKRKLAATDDAFRMDAEPLLLGCDDCIVDLDACIFRPGTPDDLVSMSVGYSALDASDPHLVAAVDDFMVKAYPLAAERELIRKYFGYAMMGKHDEKLILFLSDRRQGYNAKSTVMALLEKTLGQYAIRTDAAIYYKSDKVKGLDDHSAGLLGFEKKRIALIEECSNTVALWEERVKEFNGGGTTITGRGMYSPEIKSFPWITTSILSANENKLPHFNVEDQALIERLVTVPHRSRFVPASSVLPEEPYTYRADTSIKDHFPAWRPYFLRWMLEGLRTYRREGFADIPESCQAFKRDLVAEKDVVKEFLNEAVEPGDEDDFVKMKELYSDFDEAYRSLQRDKKTKKNSKVFQSSVERLLPDAFRARFTYYTEGKRHEATSVVTGFKKRKIS